MTPEEYTRHDALDLARLVRAGETTPTELLDAALELTCRHNGVLNAVVARFEHRARAAIEAIDPAAPFAGVPFLLKDLYAQLEGTPLTNGSALFRDYVCDHDSELVLRYLRSGMVIFGRTASPELGITTTTESAIFGKTRNPWHLEHSSGGSSGGAAAACAAGIVPIAHASDGGGSIRIPASCCGLFGLKPTRGRITAAPDKGEGWAGLSVAHAVSRTVRDSAALLDAVCGPAAGDPYWAPPPERPYLEETGRRPDQLRIAWTAETFNGSETDAECARALEQAVTLCGELGHELVEAHPAIDRQTLAAIGRMIISANVRATLDHRATELGVELRKDHVEPLTWRTAIGVDDQPIWAYPRAVDAAHGIGRQLGRFFEQHDVLLTPTMATPPLPLGAVALDQKDGEAFVRDLMKTIGFTQLMNIAGNPAMSIPLHWSDAGLPVGLQFAAASGREDLLFRLAAQLEEAQPWRDRRPVFEK